ncbi:MAG: DNA polymerase III subunit gamma/tau [Cytophagales bacterium]|nr:MAG: DNA polymerase III subunit gamma/tau [Rhodothermaeota bacterium MED-G18]
MEKYVVSARKYRPTKFDDVVGQDHVTTTLQNAVKNNKVAQSLLFCGPRGVGKTTCARILANEINEFDFINPLENSNNFNIYELDAASNNSVDDIRNLIEQVRYPPQSGKYKVYIIDEVHMLSNAAFNAFLKTLEEPPSYAIFILATTEKSKVIPTILSRCQIYDFNRIEIPDIKNKLSEILDSENIKYEDEALHLIARKADGALRDALSTLDLIKTFIKEASIKLDDVTKNLNILDTDYLFKISNFIYNGDVTNSIILHKEIINNGFESISLLSGLTSHFKNLLYSKNEKLVELMDVSESEKIKYKTQSEEIEIDFIEKGIELLNEFGIKYKQSNDHQIHTEIVLLKLCSLRKKKTKLTTEEKEVIKSVENSSEINPVSSKPKSSPPSLEEDLVKDTPNLKNILNESSEPKKEEKVEIEEEKIVPVSLDLNIGNLKNAIKEFRDGVGDKKSEEAILNREISLEDSSVILSLENELELSIFEDLKSKLHSFLKKKFDQNIDLKTKLNIKKKEKTIYTNKDKFEYLSKQNSNLEDLKNKLGLDYEF